MKIKFKSTFTNRLERQVSYIVYDSPSRARRFKNDLLEQIKKIPNHPYSFRKSIYFNDNSIRDLIFKGYCIVFRVNESENSIEIFGFTKYQENSTD
ncbi:MAG: type II toxin-antitoxin system RelE/ParE family toxin [Bacteroidota bacterium]